MFIRKYKKHSFEKVWRGRWVKDIKLKEEMVLNGNDYCEIRQGTSPHNPTDYARFNYVMFRKLIDKRIKELKGE